jgi:hypothetical protein
MFGVHACIDDHLVVTKLDEHAVCTNFSAAIKVSDAHL